MKTMSGQLEEIIEMLEQSTLRDLLKWERDGGTSSFYTTVNGCRLELSVTYDVNIKDSVAKLRFYNISGVQFKTVMYIAKLEREDYARLNRLNDIIKDKYYKIAESEQLILSGLEKMLNTPHT